MDTAETYIKMCEGAEEIQRCREHDGDLDWELGDFYTSRGNAEISEIINGRKSNTWHKPTYWVGVYVGRVKQMDIWLPRQDQLQEMLGCNHKDWLGDFTGFAFDIDECKLSFEDYSTRFTSMEQLWLAFVMKEKGKTWDGEEWVSGNNTQED